ncbi:MAG TPA: cyclic nucleotide-binding domain-containing protein [Phototrophicaceae bacterium]|nr:cyclic nucleotide-binding domain-containing protein [Phototrophicaceae bacterium]
MQELVEVIRHIEIFHGLNDAQLAEIAQITQREVYNGGDTIIEQDAPGDSMYIIVEGQVEVLKRDAEGENQTALFLGEGQVFGELALLDQGLRSATIVADEDPTVVYSLMRDTFDALCLADTALGYHIMRNLALDMAFKLRHTNLDE